MRTLDYFIYDVFTDTVFAGNPLAVVLDADGLGDVQMQTIAKEFNLSETIFFQKPTDANHSAKVRIFMPIGELPFAGHPTIGGAVAFAGCKNLSAGTVILEEGVGPVICQVDAQADRGRASFTVPKISKQMPFAGTVDQVAKASGIATSDIGIDGHAVSIWSAGVPFLMVPVKSLNVLEKLSVDATQFTALDVHREGKVAAGYYYAQTGDRSYQVRMFAPWDGIPEDPATGSAAAAFSGAVNAFGRLADGLHDFTIVQGVEMGRRSQIGLSLNVKGGEILTAQISGQAVKVAKGTLYLPD